MNFYIKWTDYADGKLWEIFEHVKQEAGENTAHYVRASILRKTLFLHKHPFTGHPEKLLQDQPETYRFVLKWRYKIIYWVEEENSKVFIANVFHTRQHPSKLRAFLRGS